MDDFKINEQNNEKDNENNIKNNKLDNSLLDNYIKQEYDEKQENSSFIKILIVMIIIFLSIIFGIFLFADNKDFLINNFGEDSWITKVFVKFSQSSTSKKHAEFNLPFGPRRQNILLLGVDSNGAGADLWKGTRTDTIILLNIDPKTKSLNAISIPRDSKVYLPDNNGTQKINTAHAIGGVNMTIKTVENTLGVKVDRYIMVHDEAVRKIVEAMGGLDIYVEKNMKYNDNAGHLHINLTKGNHHLSPDEVVGYLRYRHDAMGDIGRTRRQQWFLRGFLEDIQKPETIVKIPQILSVAHKYIKTDMTLYEMSQYAAAAKHFNMDNIEISTLPGAPNKKGYISYWILDPEKTQEVVNRLIYREKQDTEKVEYTAGVMYSNALEAESKALIEELKQNNVTVKCTGTSNATHAQFVAHSKDVSPAYYNWLKKKIPDLHVGQFVYDPINYYCGDTDYTIVLQ